MHGNQKKGFPYSALLETATAASSPTIFITSNVIKPKLWTSQSDILMYGLKSDDSLYNYLNTRITIAVQNFILKTKRFW